MGKLGWSVLSALAGLLIGVFFGGSVGSIFGSVGGAVAGTYVGVCQAAIVAVDQSILDEATADRVTVAALGALAKSAPRMIDPNITDLASCRSSGVAASLTGK